MNYWKQMIRIEKDWAKIKPDIIKESGQSDDIVLSCLGNIVLTCKGQYASFYMNSSVSDCAYLLLDAMYRQRVYTAIVDNNFDPMSFKSYNYSYKDHLLEFEILDSEFYLHFKINTPVNEKELCSEISKGVDKIKKDAMPKDEPPEKDKA